MLTNSELIPAKDTITYKTLTQEACSGYHNLVDSNRWKPADHTKEADEPELPNDYSTGMEKVVSKALKQLGFDNRKAI